MRAENISIGVLAMLLERDLTILHGPMMTGEPLRRALGYPSHAAFRQALARKTLPVPIFDIEKRRGKFALTKDVATWVAQQRTRARNCNASKPTTQENP